MQKLLKTLLAATAASVIVSSGTLAADITLRVADSLPPQHPFTVSGLQFFMARVKQLTGDKIAFQHFPAQQLGKANEMLRVAQTGIADIAYVAPGYISDTLPLSEVATLPGLFTTSCEGGEAFRKLATGDGILNKQELEPLGVKVLTMFTLPTSELYPNTRSIDSIESFKGLKVRSGSVGNDLTLQAVGAVPVRISGPEVMEALQRGTVDANIGTMSAQTTYGFDVHSKYATLGASLGSFAGSYVISLKKWNTLPKEVRTAMEEAGRETDANLCEALQAEETKSLKIMEGKGIKINRLDAATKAAIQAAVSGVQDTWAKGLDARGLSGSKVLAAFRDARKKVN
jgi:TRAP-type C4-dicarboxylate transport system substrate-binding protein